MRRIRITCCRSSITLRASRNYWKSGSLAKMALSTNVIFAKFPGLYFYFILIFIFTTTIHWALQNLNRAGRRKKLWIARVFAVACISVVVIGPRRRKIGSVRVWGNDLLLPFSQAVYWFPLTFHALKHIFLYMNKADIPVKGESAEPDIWGSNFGPLSSFFVAMREFFSFLVLKNCSRSCLTPPLSSHFLSNWSVCRSGLRSDELIRGEICVRRSFDIPSALVV